jgi:hypothetical protein
VSNLSKTTRSELPSSSNRSVSLTLRRVFVGEQGIRAGWSVLLFAAIFWILNTVVTGTPDSGLIIQNHLLASHPSGNPLWSGGTVGPEGSILLLPLVILMAAGMWLWWGGKRKGSMRPEPFGAKRQAGLP